jgi:N-methylhydantoinase B/oxoprolinase/acetone carboxylase alpha subunit
MAQQKEEQKKLLSEIMEADQRDGLYDNHIGDTNKMVTAVEWLIDQIKEHEKKFGIPPTKKGYMNLIEKANELHKKQVIEAWLNGETFLNDNNDSLYSPEELRQEAIEYYKRTYGK